LFCQIETRERKASHWLRQNKFVDANFKFRPFWKVKLKRFVNFSTLKIPKTIKSDEKLFAHYLRSSVNSWEFEEVFKLRVHKIEF